METRSSNRLHPQSMLSTTTHTSVPRHQPPPQKPTLRRRCRSECLQMTPVIGLSTEPKQFDDLNELRRKALHHHHGSSQMHQQVPQGQQQPVFRNTLHKYSPMLVLRNQDSAKNIFSFIDNRGRLNGGVNGGTLLNGLLRNSTKENMSSSPSIFHGASGDDTVTDPTKTHADFKDSIMRDFELYKEKPARSNQDFVTKYPAVDSYDALLTTSAPAVANLHRKIDNKRRVRARSESEPHDLYQTKHSPNNIDKNLVLKRSREDKSYLNHHKNGQLTDFEAAPGATTSTRKTTLATASLPSCATPSSPTQKQLVNNPNHTKIVSNHLTPRSGTPRYPIKPLNGIRKLRSRHTLTKTKTNKSMVVTIPPRCPTPVTIANANGGPNAGSALPISNKPDGGEESDTGCSSLDDDDDFDDIGEFDLNDSLSDSEDNSLQSQLSTSLDAKFSDTSIQTTDCVIGRYASSAPLSASLFPHVPPYISFATHSEKGPPMPAAITKVLKWKLTTITPIVIRKILLNSGFRLLRKTNDWMGIWGKHMKSPCFKTVRSYQKINHIPGTFQIGRKDRVWRNLQVQMARHGKKEFGFMPRTYVIPNDLKQLRKIWPKYSQRNVKWIIKPPASARGTGIKVVNRWSQIPKRKPLIVQRYIERPLLINGSKFDLRLYVLVTSINPLRVYMHTDGLARFASVKYSEKSDTLHDRYMHLTNYSINKLSSNYSKNEDANACKGHKWTVKSLWTHLAAQGINVTRLWGAVRNLVLRTILAGENAINQLTKVNMGSKYNCYELFGIDVILDSELKPWLLEVNISPSLHSASPLDLHVKGPLVQALLNTALFQVPPRIPVTQQEELMAEQGLTGSNLCYDKRLFVTNLSKAERIKHVEYTSSTIANRDDYLDSILEDLTPDDIRCLMIAEDELSRSAPLERIFPSSTSHAYLKFIENPRYYNRLMDAWEYRYGSTGDNNNREEGIALLKSFAEDKIHLRVPPPPVKKDSENNTAGNQTLNENKVVEDDNDADGTTEDLINNCVPTIIPNGNTNGVDDTCENDIASSPPPPASKSAFKKVTPRHQHLHSEQNGFQSSRDQ